MDSEEFLKRVSGRAGLHNRDQACAAVEIVFKLLRDRMSTETGKNVASQLPTDLKELWESSLFERVVKMATGVERMDLDEFLSKVRDSLDLESAEHSREVVEAVFTTLQEQITPGATHKIGGEVSSDLREFWSGCKPESTPSEVHRQVAAQETGTDAPALREDSELTEWPEVHPGVRPERLGSPEGEYDSQEIGPSAASVFRSDDQVRAEVERLLEASDEIDAHEIDVEVMAGRVVLRGQVHSQKDRERARHIAHEALGAQQVVDELTVDAS